MASGNIRKHLGLFGLTSLLLLGACGMVLGWGSPADSVLGSLPSVANGDEALGIASGGRRALLMTTKKALPVDGSGKPVLTCAEYIRLFPAVDVRNEVTKKTIWSKPEDAVNDLCMCKSNIDAGMRSVWYQGCLRGQAYKVPTAVAFCTGNVPKNPQKVNPYKCNYPKTDQLFTQCVIGYIFRQETILPGPDKFPFLTGVPLLNCLQDSFPKYACVSLGYPGGRGSVPAKSPLPTNCGSSATNGGASAGGSNSRLIDNALAETSEMGSNSRLIDNALAETSETNSNSRLIDVALAETSGDKPNSNNRLMDVALAEASGNKPGNWPTTKSDKDTRNLDKLLKDETKQLNNIKIGENKKAVQDAKIQVAEQKLAADVKAVKELTIGKRDQSAANNGGAASTGKPVAKSFEDDGYRPQPAGYDDVEEDGPMMPRQASRYEDDEDSYVPEQSRYEDEEDDVTVVPQQSRYEGDREDSYAPQQSRYAHEDEEEEEEASDAP